MQDADPVQVQIEAIQHHMEGQIEAPVRFPNSRKFLTSVADSIILSDGGPLGKIRWDVADADFEKMIKAYRHILLSDPNRINFAKACIAHFFSAERGITLETVNKLTRLLANGVGPSFTAAAAVIKIKFVYETIIAMGAGHMVKFLAEFANFMLDPRAERYEVFKNANPIVFGILNGIADMGNMDNCILFCHGMLAHHINQRPTVVADAAADAAAAAQAAAAAAAANPAAPAAAPAADDNDRAQAAAAAANAQAAAGGGTAPATQ